MMRTESTDKLVKEYNSFVDVAIKKVEEYFKKHEDDYRDFLAKGYEFVYEKNGYRYSSMDFPLFLMKDPDGTSKQIFYSLADGTVTSEYGDIYTLREIVISQQFDEVITTLVNPQYYVSEYADLITKRNKWLKKISKLTI